MDDDSVLSDTSFCDEDEDASRARLNKLLKRENIKRLREKRRAQVAQEVPVQVVTYSSES